MSYNAGMDKLKRKRNYVSLVLRFWEKVQKSDDPKGCWVWTGSRVNYGYGDIGVGGSGNGSVRAHRLSWEMRNGPVPENLWVLHSCDNTACVNPDHLFLGTPKVNTNDMVQKGRAHLFGNGSVSNQKGEAHWKAKLSDRQVAKIRELRAKGWSGLKIAPLFDVSAKHVYDIVKGASRV